MITRRPADPRGPIRLARAGLAWAAAAASASWIAVPVIAAGLIIALAVLLAGPGTSPATPSHACRAAQSAASAYASYVRADTSFPNDDVTSGAHIVAHEVALLRAMVRAGCPATVKVVTLP